MNRRASGVGVRWPRTQAPRPEGREEQCDETRDSRTDRTVHVDRSASKPTRGRRRGLSGAAIAIWAVIGGLGILFGVFAVAIALQAAAFDVMRWLLALGIEAPLGGGIIALIWYSRVLTRTTAAGDAASSALANSEAKYRELIASAPDGIFVLDPQAKVLDVNEAGETLLGRERGDIVGHSFMEFVPTDRLASAHGYLDDRLRG